MLLLASIWLGATPNLPPSTAAEPGAENSSYLVSRWIRELGDDQFAVRREARRQLRELLADTHSAGEVTRSLNEALASAQLSTEARFEIRSLLPNTPAPPSHEPAETITDAQLSALIESLNDSHHASRAAAQERLAMICRDGRTATRLLAPLKDRLADPKIDRDYREALELVLRRARNEWLADESLDRHLPAVSDEQIDRWIAELTAPVDQDAGRQTRRQVAELELTDLLCREAYRERMIARLQAAAQTHADDESLAHLQRVLDWTRPAMAAEIWKSRRHETIQFLLVSVPQAPEGAARVTLFDRIDERVAHCVSGNTLYEGDWPVGVAIPHPKGDEWMLTLVNLPTPRRRQAYELDVRRPEKDRLRELSERSWRKILAEQRHLSELDAGMLGQLDPAVVSRFVGDYFAAVPDRPLPRKNAEDMQFTEHDLVCAALAAWGLSGAHEALDREAAARGEPNGDRLPLARLASLSIALRDPWPGVDAWLATLVAKPAEFRTPVGKRADLSAIAAAILLHRHHQTLAAFDLEPLDESPQVEVTGFQPYLFSDPAGRDKVLRWWAALEQARAERPSAAREDATRR